MKDQKSLINSFDIYSDEERKALIEKYKDGHDNEFARESLRSIMEIIAERNELRELRKMKTHWERVKPKTKQ